MSQLDFDYRGRMPYQAAWDEQRRLHALRVAEQCPDTVLLLEHDPVYTAGRRTEVWERPIASNLWIAGRRRPPTAAQC